MVCFGVTQQSEPIFPLSSLLQNILPLGNKKNPYKFRLNSDDPPKPRKEMIHPFDGSQKPPVGATFLATEPKDEVTIRIPTKRHTYVEETHMVITRRVGIRHRLP